MRNGSAALDPLVKTLAARAGPSPSNWSPSKKFQTLPYGPLRKLIDVNILVTPSGEKNSKPATFATMRMNTSNQCSMLTEERLCRIQAQLGESFLPHSCAIYPRIVNSIAGVEDKSLALSCPEAARLVLLNPHLLNTSHPRPSRSRFGARIEARQVPPANTLSPHSEFWPIRGIRTCLDSQSRLSALATPVLTRQFLPPNGWHR